MTSVGSFEAKTHLPRLLERVARGEKIVITKHGEPVAMLVPVRHDKAKDLKQVIAEFKAYSKRQGRTLSGVSVRALIDEGRRF
jgi:prevent-host-death family protein